MRTRIFALLFVFALALSASGQQPPAVEAQTPQQPPADEETVRVRHRVVFLDALVRDKRTNAPVADLKEENFEILADGRPRKLTYFTREGDAARKPLALTLVLDLRRSGAGRYLRRADIMQAMAAELSKLPPQDEVSLIVLDARGSGGQRRWLVPFTRDRAQLAAALALVPSLVVEEGQDDTEAPPRNEGPTFSATYGGGDDRREAEQKGAERKEAEQKKAADVTADKGAGEATAAAEPARPSGENVGASDAGEPGPRIVSVKTGDAESDIESEIKMMGKDGSTVTRTVYKSGRVSVKRVSKKGHVEIETDEEFDIAGTVHEVVKVSGRERPQSRAAMVWVSDGLVPVFYVERDIAVADLTLSNVTFNALVTDMKFGFKLFKPVLKPLGNVVGIGIYGTSQHIAKETGGEALRVNRPSDYANGLARIIGNLTGRYSLGFRLDDDERGDDGQLHPLEVRVRARDAKGKERKLTVVTRRGFY
ncbi:MAG TPA: VWA domain-containing protein, partial [Pyrinomonadaceae bacterium]|nr:VWA domain-containing protein [Pyrinomonadaceae bacterium]